MMPQTTTEIRELFMKADAAVERKSITIQERDLEFVVRPFFQPLRS